MSVDGRMLARFSDHAAATVFMARQEARRLGHGSVDPEHLLLGLIRVGEGTGISALDRLGVSREALRRQLEESIGHGPGGTYGPVRFSLPRGQKVLTSALPEALAQCSRSTCMTASAVSTAKAAPEWQPTGVISRSSLNQEARRGQDRLRRPDR